MRCGKAQCSLLDIEDAYRDFQEAQESSEACDPPPAINRIFYPFLLVLTMVSLPLQQNVYATWLYTTDENSEESIQLKNGDEIKFTAKRKFQYFISRDHEKYRRSGAIVVLVFRNYTQEWPLQSEFRSKTLLYRSELSISQKECQKEHSVTKYSGTIRTKLYSRYHLNQIGNAQLRNQFHAEFDKNKRTDSPVDKLAYYLFPQLQGRERNNEKPPLKRAYLIIYSGIAKEGSLIPFEIGLSDSFASVLIIVRELHPDPAIDRIPRLITLNRK